MEGNNEKYRVVFTKRVEKKLREVDCKFLKKFQEVIRYLESFKLHYLDIKKLKGFEKENLFRIRIGKYRIIVKIDKKNKQVIVIDVGLRENIYDKI